MAYMTIKFGTFLADIRLAVLSKSSQVLRLEEDELFCLLLVELKKREKKSEKFSPLAEKPGEKRVFQVLLSFPELWSVITFFVFSRFEAAPARSV